jgi:hypothetical protein
VELSDLLSHGTNFHLDFAPCLIANEVEHFAFPLKCRRRCKLGESDSPYGVLAHLILLTEFRLTYRKVRLDGNRSETNDNRTATLTPLATLDAYLC